MRRASRGGCREVFSLQLDMKSFFITVHRPTLEKLVLDSLPKQMCQENKMLHWLVTLICRHDARKDFYMMASKEERSFIKPYKSWLNQPEDCGIAIGNLSSQFFANVILTKLDHFISRCLKPVSYLRYMDDLLLIDVDADKLAGFVPVIDRWIVDNRRQNLNHQKTKLSSFKEGIEFLGYNIKQVNLPANPALVQIPRKKLWQTVSSARILETKGIPEPEVVDRFFAIKTRRKAHKKLACLNARIGHLLHAKSYGFRKDLQDVQKEDETLPLSCL
jgi:RNA-directed DNA polymerase